MKKGLLSLLVVALTVVGCQDYDDQFDSLNKTLVSLQADVKTMEGITTAITALDAQLTALEGKVLQDGDLAAITTQITTIQTAINNIPAPADVSGINTQVAGLNDEIDAIIDALGKLTKAGSTYAGDLNIRNLAELEIAETAFGIDPAVTDPDPMAMNVTGKILITADATSLAETAIQARLQVVMNSIKSAGNDLTASGVNTARTLPILTFVGGNADFKGTSTLGLPKLTSVIGQVTFDLAGAIDYLLLSSAGSVKISQTSTVTSVDLSGLTSGNTFTTTDNLALPNATSVKVSGIPYNVNCALATTFIDVSSTAIASYTIILPAATSVNLAATGLSSGSIVANSANITLSGATSIATSTFHALGLGADAAITSSNNTISATTISLAALTTVTNVLTVTGLATFSAPALTSATGTFSSDSVTNFVAPLLTTSGLIDLKDASPISIHVKNIGDFAAPANDIADWALVQTLTLDGQTGDLQMTLLTKMVTFNYTGVEAAHPASFGNDIFVTTANASLTTVVIDQASEMRIFSVVSNTIANITTAGKILNTIIDDNDLLAAINFGHTYKNGQNATSIQIRDNNILASLNASSLEKCKVFEITGNTSMTSIVPPTVTANLPGTITPSQWFVHTNSIQGTYTAGVAATQTSEAVSPTATSTELSAIKLYIDAVIAQGFTDAGSMNFNLDVDRIDSDADGAFDDGKLSGANGITGDANDGGMTGNVTTAVELSLF